MTKKGKRRRWPRKKSVTAPVGPGESLVSSGSSRETGDGVGVLDSPVQPLCSSAGSSTAVPVVEGISPVCLAAAPMAFDWPGPTWRCGTCTLDNLPGASTCDKCSGACVDGELTLRLTLRQASGDVVFRAHDGED